MPTKKPVKKAAAKKSSTKAPAKKASSKAPAKKSAAKAPAKKPVKNAAAKKSAAKAPAKKAAAKAPVKKSAAKAPAKKAAAKAPVKKSAAKAPATKSAAKAPTKKVPAKAPANKVATKAPATKNVTEKKAPAKVAPKKPVFVKPPVPGKKAVSKDGIIANKDFDLTFLRARRAQLIEMRDKYLGQVADLDRERELLIEASGMGDDQFDEDGGEGDTLAVERERAKLLSDQDRQTVVEIEAALARIESGDYGYSVISTRPIPRERLEFIPWATELVTERVGGIGQR